jgi:hypothetical protein
MYDILYKITIQLNNQIQVPKMHPTQMPILSLVIPCVAPDISAVDIARTFYKLEIATVKAITLLPICEAICAYIEIGYWHDTETAYRFIERLRNPEKETRLVYDDPSWWIVMENSDNYHIPYDPKYSSITTNFVHNYGEEPVEAIHDVKTFFANPSVYDDYEVLHTIDLGDYEKPMILKEQHADCVFDADEWNKFMEGIDNDDDDEEYRKAVDLEVEEYERYREGRYQFIQEYLM